jgi:hypothetical protein
VIAPPVPVNRRCELTPAAQANLIRQHADRRRDPAPIHTLELAPPFQALQEQISGPEEGMGRLRQTAARNLAWPQIGRSIADYPVCRADMRLDFGTWTVCTRAAGARPDSIVALGSAGVGEL